MNDVQQLKEELAALKEQFKKKCEKLKKANEKLASYRRQGRPPSKQNPTENK